MTLKLTTTVKAEAEVEIELPAFFKNGSIYYAVLSESMIIQITDFVSINYIAFGHATKSELSVSEKITFREFYPTFHSSLKQLTYSLHLLTCMMMKCVFMTKTITLSNGSDHHNNNRIGNYVRSHCAVYIHRCNNGRRYL